MHVTRRSDTRKTSGALVLTLALVAGSAAAGHPHTRDPMETPPPCVLAEGTATWLQRALTGWSSVRRDALRLDGSARPPMVFYDSRCEYHLDADTGRLPDGAPIATGLVFDGAPVNVRARVHGGQVRLPDGSHVSADDHVARATMLSDRVAYFVMATPELWRRIPAFTQNPDTEAFFLGVTMHELAHTAQLPHVLPRLKAVVAEAGLTSLTLDDDVIQKTFGDRPGFREAFEAERDALYDAVAAPDAVTRGARLGRALSLIAERRARFFTGAARHFEAFENEFLSLEGAGQWAAYRFALLDRPGRSPADAAAFVRDTRTYWSQDEGLALFLLLELEVPDWQRRVFGPDDPGPIALLAEALARR